MRCKNCGKPFEWADEMANMALRDKSTEGLCRACRSKVLTKILEEKKKGSLQSQ
jgi:DNA-directed RNA polymerase subunit RPC12/RpoP